ncbi:MAG: hypothetical protein KatS3mg111_4273 [Pirellulaceae bacterium]|nr:MAG: hypothetical protein KatS3mg111_4273 [Pirellulaceae bacterium]
MEVLFATGIAVAGLLGIASLLLMSGRDASVANRATESQALARAWYEDFLARQFHYQAQWLRYEDVLAGSPWTGVSKAFPGGNRLTGSVGSLGAQHVLPPGKVSLCIDPYFYSSRDWVSSSWGTYKQASRPNNSWYRPAVFPYYQDGYNPLIDPRLDIGSSSGLAWEDQPRMQRLSIRRTPGAFEPMIEAMVRRVFVSQDEVIEIGEEEAEQAGFESPVPSLRRFQPVSGNVPGRASAGNKYSWLATLSPLEATRIGTEQQYVLSLVVLFERDRLFNPTLRTGGVPDPRSTPQGERLMWVVPQSGNFVGGNGGRVQLLFSSAMEEEIRVGDWVMLAKHVAAEQVPGVGVRPYSVFRWYRVVSVDSEPTLLDVGAVVADPYGNANAEPVWSVHVGLAGPDWVFGTYTGAGLQAAPTTATLVKGAVAVYERVVEIPD